MKTRVGNAGHAGHRADYAARLTALGQRVLLAENPGYGSRPGQPGEAALVADAAATLAAARRQFPGPLLVAGDSLGAELDHLSATIAARAGEDAKSSYTASLLAAGVEKCAKKLGEEAVETAIEAVSRNRNGVTAEAADLLYHLLVLLEASGVGLADVMKEIERRQGTSGIAEKAARPRD